MSAAPKDPEAWRDSFASTAIHEVASIGEAMQRDGAAMDWTMLRGFGIRIEELAHIVMSCEDPLDNEQAVAKRLFGAAVTRARLDLAAREPEA